MIRPDKTDFYFAVVKAASLRSTCDRGRSGAALIKHGRVIATGYSGSASGTSHCDDVGHEMIKHFVKIIPSEGAVYTSHCIRTVHAELNAILQSARFGPSTEGAHMYCTMFPCYACAQAIINAGITEVHALSDDQKSAMLKRLFDGVKVRSSFEDLSVKLYSHVDNANGIS